MRVVAGRLRGRKLLSVRGTDTRPTTARARGGLFDWLGPRVQGARILDLFAGGGAAGIEALSRGASECVFVERARPALKVLRRNLEDLELQSFSKISAADVARALRALTVHSVRFDLIVADPPYRGDWLERLASDEQLAELLGQEGVFIAERSKRDAVAEPSVGLRLRESRRYGGTVFDWYEKSGVHANERQDDRRISREL